MNNKYVCTVKDFVGFLLEFFMNFVRVQLSVNDLNENFSYQKYFRENTIESSRE